MKTERVIFIRKISVVLGFFILFCFSFVYAASSDTPGVNSNFDVTPVIPSNQIGNIGTYFNLQAKPNSEQDLIINVHNKSSHSMTLEIQSANALNTQNGGIDYTSKDNTNYSSFLDKTFSMKARIQVPYEVTMNAGETKEIPIHVSIPNQTEGSMLGGILFSEKNPLDEKKADKSVTIYNKTVFSVAVYLQFSSVTNGEFRIAKPVVSYLPSGIQMLINMENDIPSVIKNINGSYQVFDKNQQSVFKGTISNLKLAPKTKLSYPVFWDSKSIEPGIYQLHVQLIVNGKTIEKIESFEIKEKELVTYKKKVEHQNPDINIPSANQKEVSKKINEKTTIPLWMYVSFGFLILIIVVLFILLRKKSKKENEEM